MSLATALNFIQTNRKKRGTLGPVVLDSLDHWFSDWSCSTRREPGRRRQNPCAEPFTTLASDAVATDRSL